MAVRPRMGDELFRAWRGASVLPEVQDGTDNREIARP